MFKRASSFEVYGAREGRWLIDGVFEDEKQALDHARTLISSGRWDEVKVLRQRSLLGGLASEAEIFRQKRPEPRERPITFTPVPIGRDMACNTVEDLFGFEARLIIGRMFRQYLDRYNITATELLHGFTYQRKLYESTNLIMAAVGHVARAQVDGPAVKQRMAALEALANRIMTMARDLHAEKKTLPKFDASEVALTSQRIRAKVGPERHDHVFMSALTDYLIGTNSVMGKLETVLSLMTDDLHPALFLLFEGYVIDAIGNADIVKELLGPQPTLGSSLCTLADFLHGRPPAKGVVLAPAMLRIGDIIQKGRAPLTRALLVERLRQGVAQGQPLDKRDAHADAKMLEQLTTHLRGADGSLLGGSVMERALTRREIHQREALLRAQGLHDVADNLIRSYKMAELS